MELKELVNLTDMIFHKIDGVVKDHGGYISIETPNNPNYFWGNYLIFSQPPKKGDMNQWRKLFRERFSHNLKIKHETFSWEGSGQPVYSEFLEEGFIFDPLVVMAADEVIKPKKCNTEIKCRPFETAKDWDEALEFQILTHKNTYKADHYRTYRQVKNERYRKMIASGMGQWFGAFLDGKLVGDMGLFKTQELGRFQLVSTHPDFRRQGICGRLLFEVSQYGFAKMGIKTLVIVGDENYFARDIYASVGFKVISKVPGLERRPKEALPT